MEKVNLRKPNCYLIFLVDLKWLFWNFANIYSYFIYRLTIIIFLYKR